MTNSVSDINTSPSVIPHPNGEEDTDPVTELFQQSVAMTACDLVQGNFSYQPKRDFWGTNLGFGLGLIAVLSGVTGTLQELGYSAGFEITHTLGHMKGNHFVYQFPAGGSLLVDFFKTRSLTDLLLWLQTIIEPQASFYPWGNDTTTGQSMGYQGEAAFDAACGLVPVLVLDSALVISGMHLRDRNPILGNMLVATGITANAIYSIDPILYAFDVKAIPHDSSFNPEGMARFIECMSEVTGLSTQVTAIATASIWAAFIPLVALAAYFHTRTKNSDLVPEGLAVKQWIQKAKNDPKIAQELQTLSEKYPRKAQFEKLLKEPNNESEVEEIFLFVIYLLDTLPARSLEPIKEEMAKELCPKACTDKIQTGLAATSIVGNVSSVASLALSFFAETSHSSSLGTAATVMSHVAPVFIAGSVLSAGYQVYKDFQCPNDTIPRAAKMISVAKLIVTIATATLIIAGLFVPGLHLVLLVALFIGCIASLALSYSRSQVIKRQFEYLRAIEPSTWKIMTTRWKHHIDQGTKITPGLKRWSRCVQSHSHSLPKANSQKILIT